MAKENSFDMDATSYQDNFGIVNTQQIDADQVANFILGDAKEIELNTDTDTSSENDTTIKNSDDTEDLKRKEEEEKKASLTNDIIDNIFSDKDVDDDKSNNSKTASKAGVEDEDDSDNTFQILSKNLFDLGVFVPSEEDDDQNLKIESDEDFRDLFVKQVKLQSNMMINNFITEKHGEEGMELFNALFVDGVPPKDYLSKYAEMQSLKELDISDESTQEKVCRMYYKRRNFPEDKIDQKIKKLIDYGDLEEEASLVYEKLIEEESEQLEKIQYQKQKQAEYEKQERDMYVKSISTILTEKLKARDFDGIPLTDKIAKEAFENLIVEKYKLPSGEKLTEFDKAILELRKPENYEKKVKLWLLLQNDLDLSKVKVKTTSEKNEKLFNNLAIKEKVNKRTNPSSYGTKFTDLL